MTGYSSHLGIRDFVVNSDTNVALMFRWRHNTHCFLLCFLFITVYPHVCMCTEMFQTATPRF